MKKYLFILLLAVIGCNAPNSPVETPKSYKNMQKVEIIFDRTAYLPDATYLVYINYGEKPTWIPGDKWHLASVNEATASITVSYCIDSVKYDYATIEVISLYSNANPMVANVKVYKPVKE